MTIKKIKHVTCEHLLELEAKPEREHVVLDLRDFAEFEAGHIKDSHSLPKKELATNVENVVPEKDSRVIVVVGPTQESEIEGIHETLAGLGYQNVEFLSGGFDRYCEIAPIEIEPDLTVQTPEEQGFKGDDLAHIDPEENEGDPLL
jgi:rhodanese-related sulfurtransferase